MDKKIAFISEVYQDSEFSTGGEKLNYLLLKGLVQNGYRVDIFTNKIVKNSTNLPDEIYRLEDLPARKEDYLLILSGNAVIPSDITYIHGHSYPFRIKMISNRFSHLIYKIVSNKSHQKRLAEYNKIRQNICKTRKVIVSSRILKEDMIKNYGVKPEQIEIIAPPYEKFDINKQKNEIFTFGISAIGFERKGGYLTLNAIRKLKHFDKKFKVKIIYPSRNLFVKLLVKLYGIEKYCEFLPVQKDMENFYNSIDCLLMPSLIEPFGMVCTEAMSCGVPVITAVHCGAADFIQNGVNGFLYDNNKKLADAIKMMLNADKSAYQKLCCEAAASVADLNEQKFVEKYIDVIEQLAGEVKC